MIHAQLFSGITLDTLRDDQAEISLYYCFVANYNEIIS